MHASKVNETVVERGSSRKEQDEGRWDRVSQANTRKNDRPKRRGKNGKDPEEKGGKRDDKNAGIDDKLF